MKVFIQSIIAQLLLTPYIYWRGYQALPARRAWRSGLTGPACLACSLYVGICLGIIALFLRIFLPKRFTGRYFHSHHEYMQHVVYREYLPDVGIIGY